MVGAQVGFSATRTQLTNESSIFPTIFRDYRRSDHPGKKSIIGVPCENPSGLLPCLLTQKQMTPEKVRKGGPKGYQIAT
jgi:hypothetical protein